MHANGLSFTGSVTRLDSNQVLYDENTRTQVLSCSPSHSRSSPLIWYKDWAE